MQATLISSQHTAVELQWAIVDDLCPHIRSLLPAALVETLPIAESNNPLEQISAALGGQTLDTLHLVAHGRSGAFRLGGQWLDAAALLANAALLARWNVRRLALWSCEVGRDSGFVALLSELTGAEVWSSDQPLGGGEAWSLQPQTNSASAHAKAPIAPFADAAIAAWPHQLECRAEFAALLISDPFRVQGTRVEQNEISLAKAGDQPNPDSGSIRFVETITKGNNLRGSVFYTENGKPFEIQGEISRQYKKGGDSNKDVEAYYFVPDTASKGGEAVSYLLVTYTKDGSSDNTNFFKPGETYKTSSDFKAADCDEYAKEQKKAKGSGSNQDNSGTGNEPQNGNANGNEKGNNGGNNPNDKNTEKANNNDKNSGHHKCPDPFATELAGVFISNPLEIKGTKVQQNDITLASSQPSPDAGSIFFRQTGSDGNNLIGKLFYKENGKQFEIEGELSRQVKGINGSPQDVEAYYFVGKDLDFAYLLATLTKDGSKDNLSYFEPGGTYKTSSDFKCDAYFSPAVIGEVTDPGNPEAEIFIIPPGENNGQPGDNGGGTTGGGGGGGTTGGGEGNGTDLIDKPITVIDPEGNILPEETYTTDKDPIKNTITVNLEDANPDKPGDQPFPDGTYEVFIGDKDLGGISVDSKELTRVLGGPCLEAIFATRNEGVLPSRKSGKNGSKKSDKLTGSRSNRLEATAHGDSFDVLIGGAGSDTYQLGNQAGAFYAKHGVNDYARISRFQANDALVLHGQSSDYSLGGVTSLNGQLGHALSYNGDMIALIQGDEGAISSLRGNLNAPQITYV